MSGGEIKVRGIITGAAPQGEQGRRLSLITDRLGRVTAFASGGAKTRSRLIGKLRPFTAAGFSLIKGRGAYNICGVEVIDAFEEIPLDPDIYFYGAYVLEAGEYFSREGMDSHDAVNLLNLMFVTLDRLRKLSAGKLPDEVGSAPAAEEKAAGETHAEKTHAEKSQAGDFNADERILAPAAAGPQTAGSAFAPTAALICRIFELRLLMIAGEYSEEPDDKKAMGLWTYCLKAPAGRLYDLGNVSAGEAEAFILSVDRLYKRQVPHTFKALRILRDTSK